MAKSRNPAEVKAAKAEAKAARKAASKQRRSQLWQAFQIQRKEDKRLIPYMAGAFVLIAGASVAAGIYAGGFTPVEQKRTIQLIEDALCAVRAAAEDGVVAGGGTALAQIAPCLDTLSVSGDMARGVALVRSILTQPVRRIARNAGADADTVADKVVSAPKDHGRFSNHLRLSSSECSSSRRFLARS